MKLEMPKTPPHRDQPSSLHDYDRHTHSLFDVYPPFSLRPGALRWKYYLRYWCLLVFKRFCHSTVRGALWQRVCFKQLISSRSSAHTRRAEAVKPRTEHQRRKACRTVGISECFAVNSKPARALFRKSPHVLCYLPDSSFPILPRTTHRVNETFCNHIEQQKTTTQRDLSSSTDYPPVLLPPSYHSTNATRSKNNT